MSDNNDKLHIEELKKNFTKTKVITIDDFHDFYTEVFGEIKRNTVSWKIYELKKRKIIRNISRGQYVMTETENTDEDEYVVITMDIIKSSDLDYNEFNLRLKNKIKTLNEIINREYGYNRNYYISQGDEIQIVCEFDDNIGSLLMLTLSHLYPFKVRYGLGIGDIGEELKKNSWEMNGPIFWNARDQLIKVKNSKDYDGRIISSNIQVDQMCNNILPLINENINKITVKQWEVIKSEMSKMSMQETISQIGISKTSYYDRLSVSNIDEILRAFKTIIKLIEIRRRIN